MSDGLLWSRRTFLSSLFVGTAYAVLRPVLDMAPRVGALVAPESGRRLWMTEFYASVVEAAEGVQMLKFSRDENTVLVAALHPQSILRWVAAPDSELNTLRLRNDSDKDIELSMILRDDEWRYFHVDKHGVVPLDVQQHRPPQGLGPPAPTPEEARENFRKYLAYDKAIRGESA